jgi:hypothetical protein
MHEAQIFQVKKQLDTNIDIQHFSATLSQKLFVQVSSGFFCHQWQNFTKKNAFGNWFDYIKFAYLFCLGFSM